MKDLKVLWMCGLPGLTPDKMIDVDFEAIEDDPEGVVRIDNADFLSRPVRLGSSEASALIVALRALREGSPDVLPRRDRPLPGQARGRHGQRAGAPARRGAPAAVAARRTQHRAAARRRSAATARPGSTTTSRPATRPRGAPSTRSSCSPARATTTSTPGATSPRRAGSSGSTGCTPSRSSTSPAQEHDLTPRDLSDGLFEPGPDDVEAVMHLERYARWVADYYPVDSVEELGDGRLEARLRVGDPRWLVRLALRVAPGLTVRRARRAERRGRAYGGRDAGALRPGLTPVTARRSRGRARARPPGRRARAPRRSRSLLASPTGR